MKKIRVGGVPEHFNYPWHYGIAKGIFAKYNIEIEWADVKGGSGAMCKMLDANELDLALVLTEGIVKHIHGGSNSRIIQQYVKSPLLWGVHSAVDKEFISDDLSSARFARSRIGSGSHLMAYVHAEQKGFELDDDNFVTVGNINGAVTSFKNNESDILLWEKFMTQPLVNEGKMKRIDLCVSPWPCFMIVASGDFLEESNLINALSLAIIEAADEVMLNDDTIQRIAKQYELEESQVALWYTSVEWQTSPWVSDKMLQNVTNTLHRVDILNANPLTSKNLCYDEVKLY
ncbi:hypothetical protein OAD66_05385 [Bacteroidia bacterium]|nr:hypothetical protein [Bacteroidia bacterium]MDB9882548.1 hypothetical protein [Bacteroidia bacterium]